MGYRVRIYATSAVIEQHRSYLHFTHAALVNSYFLLKIDRCPDELEFLKNHSKDTIAFGPNSLNARLDSHKLDPRNSILRVRAVLRVTPIEEILHR